MHGIEELTQDVVDASVANIHLTSFSDSIDTSPPSASFVLTRGTRVSLTIRFVPKVFIAHLQLFRLHR
jgi:hypothetical protein